MNKGFNSILGYVLGLTVLIIGSLLWIRPVETTITPSTSNKAVTPAPSNCQISAMNMDTVVNTYIPHAPITTTLAPTNLQKDQLIVFGTIYAADRTTPLSGVLIEVWHADTYGRYDQTAPFLFRAQLRTNAEGKYQFTTIKPGRRRIDCQLLPAHIQYRVTYLDYPPYSTTLFVGKDRYLARMNTMRPDSVISVTTQMASRHVRFDIVLPSHQLSSLPH